MTLSYTPRFHLAVPDFLSEPWHAEFAAAMESIDQALFTAIVAQNANLWVNDHIYVIGDIVIDPTSGTLYSAAVNHTSSTIVTAPTFSVERTLHPTYWTSFAVTSASQAEAEAGVDNSKYMTPLRTAQAITAQSPTPGVATLAQAQEGINNTEIMTPLRSSQGITSRIASNAQAVAGTDNTVLMTPLRTEQLIAAAGIAGGTQIGFSAHKNNVAQTGIVSATPTKVTFPTELYDLGNFYDTGNSRWTPPAGMVHITGSIRASGVSTSNTAFVMIYKNGTLFKSSFDLSGPSALFTEVTSNVSVDDTASGTDYYELFAQIATGTTATVGGVPADSFFMGHFLGEVSTVTLGVGQIGFRAHKNSVDQNIPNATSTKISFGTEDYDQGGHYDTVQSRWIPPTGLVHLDGAIYFGSGLAANSLLQCIIAKNGAPYRQGLIDVASTAQGGCQVSIDDLASGSDYYELFVVAASGGIAPLSGAPINTYFAGHFLGGSQGIQGDIGPQGPSGSTVSPSINSGRLRLVSATQLSFTPFNGNRIKINGVLQQIPVTGVSGLANTSVYVNSVPSEPLAANTSYYVYVFMNAGTITADFSTTGHTTSATVGNEGTEIKIGDDSRSLIGLICTAGTGGVQFVDTPANRLVLSWFNRRTRGLRSATGTSVVIGVGNWSTLNAVSYVSFLTWGDESCQFGLWGYAYVNDTGAAGFYAGYALDQGASPTSYSYNVNNLGWGTNVGMSDTAEVAEGFHNFYPMGYAVTYTTYFNIILSGLIQG